MSQNERFAIVLEPLPDAVPPERRLAQLLKCCLRAFGLKCVYVGPAISEQNEPRSSVEGKHR
jgi:hypothetical protein